jgi:hypothetical protein
MPGTNPNNGMKVLRALFQIIAHGALKRQVAQAGHETDGREDDAALEQLAGGGIGFHGAAQESTTVKPSRDRVTIVTSIGGQLAHTRG